MESAASSTGAGSSRLRVLYSFPHPLGAAGIGTTAVNQIRALIDRGHEVTVVCTSTQQPVPHARSVIETLRIGGGRVPHRLLGLERAWSLHDRRVARLLRDTPEDWDVVHTWPLGARHTLSAARKVGVASVREVPNTHTAHAYEVVRSENVRLGLAQPRRHSHNRSPRRLKVELEEYGLADLLLVPSDFVAETFLARGIPERRLGRHQYGCDPGRFWPSPVERSASRGFSVAFVGQCEPRKGLHFALEAWSKGALAAAGGRFLVCGRFVTGYREYLAPLLAQPGVELRGFVEDVPQLLRECDALVLPSIEEGSALVTYEAQASGCVLVASRQAGAVCEHERHGLIHEAGDVAALTLHLVRLASDAQTLARLREATLAQRANLTWERGGERLAECYEQAIKAASASAGGHRG